MTPAQPNVNNMAKENYRESCKRWTLCFAHGIALSFWFIVLWNLQTVGEELDFCFDGSKEGISLIN